MAQLGAPNIEMSKFFAWLLRRALSNGVDIGIAVSVSVSVAFFWPLQIFYVSLLFFGLLPFSFFLFLFFWHSSLNQRSGTGIQSGHH